MFSAQVIADANRIFADGFGVFLIVLCGFFVLGGIVAVCEWFCAQYRWLRYGPPPLSVYDIDDPLDYDRDGERISDAMI